MHDGILSGLEDVYYNEYEEALEEMLDEDDAEYEDAMDECIQGDDCDVYLDEDDILQLESGEFDSDVDDDDEDDADISLESAFADLENELEMIESEELFEPTEVDDEVAEMSASEALEASIESMYEQMAMEYCDGKKCGTPALDDDDCETECVKKESDELDDDELDELDWDDLEDDLDDDFDDDL